MLSELIMENTFASGSMGMRLGQIDMGMRQEIRILTAPSPVMCDDVVSMETCQVQAKYEPVLKTSTSHFFALHKIVTTNVYPLHSSFACTHMHPPYVKLPLQSLRSCYFPPLAAAASILRLQTSLRS